jgi:hypothetical protein
MPPGPNDKPKPDFTPVPPGSYTSAAIILLTDGQRTTGPDPIEAAKMSADRGVRIYTVGIGTKEGETIAFEGWSMRVRLDEETLKTVANITRADYFYAGTANDLKKVYQSLSTRLVVEKVNRGWFNSNKRNPKIVIGPNATVEGTLRFQREVDLYVSNTAKIGKVEGATPRRFSGSEPNEAEMQVER